MSTELRVAEPIRVRIVDPDRDSVPEIDVAPKDDESSEADGSPEDSRIYHWIEDDPAAKNYRAFGKKLAQSRDLFRRPGYGSGLLLVLPNGKPHYIKIGADLAPVIVDRVDLTIFLDGKPKGSQLSAKHLNTMLKSEAFLGQFPVIDQISSIPVHLKDFSITKPGFNDGEPAFRILYVGNPAPVLSSDQRTTDFLDVMAFASNADRSNAVAAAITVMLRNHWPGGKPITVVTATKSHAGKDTVIAFASGQTRQCSISYQATNWALERAFVGALNSDSESGVIVIENARLDRREAFMASAFIERFATDPEPLLFSTGTGPAARRRNDIVMAISTNFGSVSEDILNRSLPIHLNPIGNVADRQSPIGNPKLEYLPEHRDEIAAELRGMIERWKSAGKPLDASVRHPFSVWAATVGGILKVNGFSDFLGNYAVRKVADDPLRQAIGLLGAACHREGWKQSNVLARHVVQLGLAKTIIPVADQNGAEGHSRGIGKVLSAHQDERFTVETDSHRVNFRLEKRRGRFDGKVEVRYRFVLLNEDALELDSE